MWREYGGVNDLAPHFKDFHGANPVNSLNPSQILPDLRGHPALCGSARGIAASRRGDPGSALAGGTNRLKQAAAT